MGTLRSGPGQLPKANGIAATTAFVAGGVLIVSSSYIHFHLWQKLGYRHIPTIGPLFLAQSIAGLVVGLLVIAARLAWVAILGVAFAASTMVGFLVSEQRGLFGFKDAWSSPFAHEAFALEMAAIGILIIAGALCLVGPRRDQTIRDDEPSSRSSLGVLNPVRRPTRPG
ncbi:MAG: hypothetical protein ABSC41_16880 [Acidimicrobiales bacterium]